MLRKSILFACLAWFCASPVSGQSAAERQFASDLRMLEQRTERIETAIGELSQAVKALASQISEQAGATRKLSVDQMVVVQEALMTVRVLREQLAETNQRLAVLSERAAAPADATDLFENARADYMAGNYALAVQGFAAYLRAAPRTVNAGSAEYYMAESYRLDRKLAEALAAYERVIANHPASDQVPDARFRRAEVLKELGREEEARAEYEVVVRTWPDSDTAALARQRLAALGP